MLSILESGKADGIISWHPDLKNIGSNHILRNREFVFTPKIEYELIAERSETNQRNLTFPYWCRWSESNRHKIALTAF